MKIKKISTSFIILLFLIIGYFLFYIHTKLYFFSPFPDLTNEILVILILIIIFLLYKKQYIKSFTLFTFLVFCYFTPVIFRKFSDFQTEANKEKGSLIIKALEEYYSKERRLPNTLDSIRPYYQSKHFEYWIGYYKKEFGYSKLSEEKYTIQFNTYGGAEFKFDRQNERWDIYD